MRRGRRRWELRVGGKKGELGDNHLTGGTVPDMLRGNPTRLCIECGLDGEIKVRY